MEKVNTLVRTNLEASCHKKKVHYEKTLSLLRKRFCFFYIYAELKTAYETTISVVAKTL